MKFKNFISAFFMAAAVVCLVACSDDEDEVISSSDESQETVDPNQGTEEPEPDNDEPDEPVTSVLSAPTGIYSYDSSGNWVAINWNTVEGAVAYKVRATDAAGTEVFSQIVSVNDCTIENLEPSTTYTAYVKALAEETEGSEFDSEEASHEISTTNDVPMIAPTASISSVTHGYAILKWELSDDAITQQPSSGTADDMYDFRLKDASGKVLRLLENDNAFAFKNYPEHQFVWGGLEPSTTYSLELRRKPVSATDVVPSNWVSATFTTNADPVPDKSGYLLFWDFENVPFGGGGPYAAYGSRITLSNDTNYDDPNGLNYIETSNGGTSNRNYVYTQTISDGTGFNQSFFDNYLPGVTPADFTNSLSHYVALGPGYFKFGASSEPTWISLPALASLTSATDVVLEVDIMPYIESSGSMMTPGNDEAKSGYDGDNNHFYVDAGNATISSVDCEKEGYGLDGEQTDLHIAYIKYPTVADMVSEDSTLTMPYWTTYTIKISGLTANDRIKIYTCLTNDGINHRMWMDNVKISKAN